MYKNNKKMKICELDFAVYELELFLDSHPTNKKAMELLAEFRKKRQAAIADYEAMHGKYIVTASQVIPTHHWNWIDGPWPWENNFMED